MMRRIWAVCNCGCSQQWDEKGELVEMSDTFFREGWFPRTLAEHVNPPFKIGEKDSGGPGYRRIDGFVEKAQAMIEDANGNGTARTTLDLAKEKVVALDNDNQKALYQWMHEALGLRIYR